MLIKLQCSTIAKEKGKLAMLKIDTECGSIRLLEYDGTENICFSSF